MSGNLLYIRDYLKVNIFNKLEDYDKKYKNISQSIKIESNLNNIKERLSYIEGKMSKDKKGFVDPITLLIIIIILALIIFWLKN